MALAKRQHKPIGILLLGSLLLGGTVLYQNTCSNLPVLANWCQQKPAQKEQLILVAGFEGNSEEESKRITDAVVESVKQAMGNIRDARIQVLNRTITPEQGSEAAREEGKKQNADVVIWGGQAKTEGNAPIDVNFEVLGGGKEATNATSPTPEATPAPPTSGMTATVSTAEPKSFKLQRQSAAEMGDLGFVALGLSRYTVGDWNGAVAKLERALQATKEENRELAEVYFYIALAYQNQQEYDKAIENYTRAIQLNPNLANAYNNRGNARYDKQDYDGAIADYTRAIQLNPNDAETYGNRGNARYDKQDYDGAIADYNRAIQLNPKYVAIAYNNRGLARSSQQDYDGAIADYNRAIQLHPNYATAYNNRGIARSSQQDYDGAIADYNRAIQFDPNYAKAYYNRGNARSSQRDYDGAISDYSKSIELDNPELHLPYNYRGLARSSKHDYEGAIADYNRAIQLNPNYAEAYYNRGNARFDKQGYKGAVDDYTQAIRFNPNLAEAYGNRGIVYRLKGDKQNAIKDLKKALELAKTPEVKQVAERQLRKLEQDRMSPTR